MSEYYLVNGRPWCPTCAKPHVRARSGWIWTDLGAAAKLLGAIVVAAGVLLLFPGGLLLQVAAAALAVGLYIRFVVLSGVGASKVSVQRVYQGRRSTIDT